MDFWCHFCRQIYTKLYNSAQNSPISLAKPTTKRGTFAQNVPWHWIILRLKIRFVSLLFCLGAQVQVGFDDAKPHWTGFFRVFGVNPLFLYVSAWVLSVVLGALSIKSWFYTTLIDPLFGDASGSLVYSLCFILLVWSLGLVLYRRKIYIKI